MRIPIYSIFFLFVFLSACDSFQESEASFALPDKVDYNFHVKPILSDRCYACHGPDEKARKGNLRLDTEEGAFAALDSTAKRFALVRGKLRKSVLVDRISTSDPETIMPPPDSHLELTAYEIALLKKWIKQGAVFKPHWSFIPPNKPSLPTVKQTDWVQSPIDHFVLSKLEKLGQQPNQVAPKEILLRRLYLDIIGLPPSIAALDAYLKEDRPGTYEKIVDQLLNSPNYGERMALDWMDVARYADSHGYSQDGYRTMYPWRDWVIQAFNENMPFDQFVRWQLAGDLFPEAKQEQKLATAFLRNHRINAEGGIIPEEYRVEYAADRNHTTATAFLGLTLECARCHDHKYDPISQEEYYQLFSFFNQVNEEGQGTPDGNTGPEVYLAEEDVEKQIAFFEQKIDLQEKLLQERAKTLSDKTIPNSKPDLKKGLISSLNFDKGPIQQMRNGSPQRFVKDDRTGRKYPLSTETKLIENERGKVISCGSYDRLFIESKLVNFKRSDPFSFSFWLEAHPETDFMHIVHKMGNKYSRQNGYDIVLKEGYLSVRLAHSLPSNLIEVQTKDPIQVDTWNHIVVTYDGSAKAKGVRIYLNGKLAEKQVLFDQLQRHITNGNRLSLGGMVHLDETVDEGYFLLDEFRMYGKTLTAVEVAHLFDQAKTAVPLELARQHYVQRKDKNYQQIVDSLSFYREQKNELENSLLGVMVMEDVPTWRPTFVLNRGLYDDPDAEVTVGTPKAVLPFPEDLPKNRMGLAQWLTDPKHPLTARVTVNRIWQQFFGRGLVSTIEDFGNQGALPTHPELLDWLAVSFIESGWDVKALIKQIVMSATYQQSSQVALATHQADPDNLLLARGPSYRLSAELLRDQALAAAGLLVDSIGGPSVKPYQPAGLWDEKSSFSKILEKYEQDQGDDLYRRSLYTFWRRTSHHPVMSVFDAPTRDNCTVKRHATNTPMQALTLMNETQFVEAARVLAEDVIRKENTTNSQIALAYRLLTSCKIDEQSASLLKQLWEEELKNFEANPSDAQELLAIGEYPRDEGLQSSRHAAMTIICSTIMNFDESVTKR